MICAHDLGIAHTECVNLRQAREVRRECVRPFYYVLRFDASIHFV